MNVNIVRVDYSRTFLKNLRKVPLKIKIAFRKRLALFIEDRSHPLLNNHQLIGEFAGRRSINITGDWRAIYSEKTDTIGRAIIVFELINTHSELYG